MFLVTLYFSIFPQGTILQLKKEKLLKIIKTFVAEKADLISSQLHQHLTSAQMRHR